jgi:hypothetical protein
VIRTLRQALSITLALPACLWASLAFGQANNDSNYQTPGNAVIGSSVQMCINTSGRAVPCATGVAGAAGYPNGATPITGNTAGTTGAVVGTLAAAVGKFTYICGFHVDAIGGTASIGPVTLAGIVGSSMVFQGASTAAGGAGIPWQGFAPCLPSSAVNTAITVTTTADGTATAVNVNLWGFQF